MAIEGVLRLAAIGGDGIGPEVVSATLPALERAVQSERVRLETTELDWGGERLLRTGSAMPEDGSRRVRDFDAVLFGAVGHEDVPDHELVWDLIIRLRQELQLAVNVRPVQALAGVPSPVRDVEGVDFLVIRENTEGEYTGIGGRGHRGTSAEIGVEVALHSRAAIRRSTAYAFRTAQERRGKVTVATKSNAMRFGYTLWDEVVAELGSDYPEVTVEFAFVDALTARLISDPRSLDVILASNLFGDVLSDLGAVLAGGLGMAPSANVAPDKTTPGVFEPVHGSAPDIAGQGIANPLACVLSAAMLLDHVGLEKGSRLLRDAVSATVGNAATRTRDLGGTANTETVARRLVEEIDARGGDLDRTTRGTEG